MPTLDARYTINGMIDTSRTVFENMETITNSCATWLSYDNLIGQWAVVINAPTAASASFDDSNIIGGINLTTTSLDGFYNECEVRFHNIDLRDKEDYVLLAIPQAERFPNEPTNRMIINAPMVNNQIQAQLIGLIELKQSRLDKIIEFKTDFSQLNLDAGDVIEVTNDVYGWTAQKFRILQTSEAEQDGTLVISITAQIYDEDVYDDSDLYEYIRETETGLVELDPLADASPVTASSAVIGDDGNSIPLLLTLPTLLGLLNKMMNGSTNIRNMISADAGSANTLCPPNSSLQTLFTNDFVAPYDGFYRADIFVDQNSSGAAGNYADIISVAALILIPGPNTVVFNQNSGGNGTWSWNDYVLTGTFNLTAGVTYRLVALMLNSTVAGGNCNATWGWNIYTIDF